MAAAVKAVRKKHERERVRKDGVPINLDVAETFDKYDADGSGDIDLDELGDALRDLNIKVSHSKLKGIMKKYCKEGADSLDIDTFDMLVVDLNSFSSAEKKPPPDPWAEDCIFGKGKNLPFQKKVREYYTHPIAVWTVASFIIGNFLVNIAEKEIDPDINNLKYESTWEQLDVVFNIVFLVELIANLYSYGGPVKAFWSNAWNVFDFFIVTVGVVLMTGIDLGPLKKLKLLRAFRVFRLFKRIKSLNQIIVALINAVPGVFNAFVVMFIFFCIYAILAVELFRDFGANGTYITHGSAENETSVQVVSSESPRGYSNGYEYYGTFMKAMFSLFQVMTGDSWAEAVARPLMVGMFGNAVTVSLFYVSFTLLTNLVMTNVVVAVLLDKFVTEPDEEEGEGNGDGDAGDAFLDTIASASSTPATEITNQNDKVSAYSTELKVLYPSGGGTPSGARIDGLESSMRELQASMELLHGKLDTLLARSPSPAPPGGPLPAVKIPGVAKDSRQVWPAP